MEDNQAAAGAEDERPLEPVVFPSPVVETGPFSEWELKRSREILAANGYKGKASTWRQAARHPHGLLRTAAFYLLTREPREKDEALFRAGLRDLDESVNALAAFGLARLGYQQAVKVIEIVARLDVVAFLGAPLAAGLLAELGAAAGYETILRGMASELSLIRIWTIKNVLPFAALHGDEYQAGRKVDIWHLYGQALKDPEQRVGQLARAQLEELGWPEALALLE